MKRYLCIALAIIGCGIVISIMATHFTPKDISVENDGFCVLDFSMRMNEIDCVYSHINPYRVWDGTLLHPKYYPYTKTELRSKDRCNPINAYTPWEYVYMYPFSLFNGYLARWRAYFALLVLSLVFIGYVASSRGTKCAAGIEGGAICLAGACLLAPAIKEDMFVGNFGILSAALVVAMALCLNEGRQMLAGVAWAVLMTKPQLGLLFLFPLIFSRQYKVIFVAVGMCVAASIPPSIACRTWPWELILQAPQASAHAFSYCALMPTALSSYLTKVFDLSTGQILIFPAVAGILLCSWVSFRLRNEKDWFVRFAPCAILAISWTYNQSHSNCLAAISIMVAVEKLIRSKMLREVLFYCVSILLFAKGGVFLGLIAENFMLQLGLSYGALVSDVIRQSCSFLSVCIVIVMSGSHGCQTIDAHSNYVGR